MTSHRGSNAYETKSRPKKEGAAPLDGAPRYRLVRSVNSITLMCPNEGEEKEAPVSLSYLLAFPHLTEPVAQAVLEICKSKASAYATCERMGRELKTGFLAFLKEKSLNNIKLEQLTTSHIEGFKTWLDRADKTGISLYALQTREHRMSYLRQVMHYLKQSDKWATQLASDLHLRPGMWAGQKDGHKPTSIIHSEDYRKIYQACKNEIIETHRRVRGMRAALQANINRAALTQDLTEKTACGKGSQLPNPDKDLGALLAVLRHRYPRQILSTKWLSTLNDRTLAMTLEEREFSNITAWLYPSARDLVPFVLMMAIHLDYNKATLMGSKVDDYRIFPGNLEGRNLPQVRPSLKRRMLRIAQQKRREKNCSGAHR